MNPPKIQIRQLSTFHKTCTVMPAFDEVTPDEVEKLLGDSTTKQCELDTAPVWIMKTLRAVFAPILALLINISISQATLPSSHKRAIIRPRLKKPGLDPSDPANYRPVSNLSFISKLIERVIHRQLSTFVEINQLLPPTQSGFRRFHSTETAVVKVYNDIVTALDAGLITALFLLDFSAAFDCVDPSILLQALELKFGITASALKWIASFLTGRTHSVRVGTIEHPKSATFSSVFHRAPSLVHSSLFYTPQISRTSPRGMEFLSTSMLTILSST